MQLQKTESEDEAELVTIPECVDSPRAKLVYTFVWEYGSVTVEEICERLRVKKLSIYPVLEKLCSMDIVQKSNGKYSAA